MALAQARSERLVDFPTSGEHFEFLSDPDDERALVFLFSVDPGGGVEQRHHHLHQVAREPSTSRSATRSESSVPVRR